MNTLKRTLAVLAAITTILPISVGAGSVCYAADNGETQIVSEPPEEKTYTAIFKVVDGETGEPIQAAECALQKNANGTSLCLAEWQWNTTDYPEKTIEGLPRLTGGSVYSIDVKCPINDYGGGTYGIMFNMERSDEPQEIVVKCYKTDSNPVITQQGNTANIRFYDELTHKPVNGVKAKVICGSKDDDGQFIEDGPTWDIDEWTSTSEPVYSVVTTGVTSAKQGYYLSAVVPEGYEPVDSQEIFIYEHENTQINIPLKHTDGCDVSISVIDPETKEPVKNGQVWLYYDDEYEIASWSLKDEPVKKIDNLIPVAGDGWYSVMVNLNNGENVLKYWFKVDENSKEQDVVLEAMQNSYNYSVQFVEAIKDYADIELGMSLSLVDGNRETLISEWKQRIYAQQKLTLDKDISKDAYYRIKVTVPEGYKPIDDIIINADDANTAYFPLVQKDENRIAKIKFVDGDTGEAIKGVKTRLITEPTGHPVFVNETIANDNGEAEFKELIFLLNSVYGIFADFPEEYDDQVYSFNFDKDENEKEIVCKAYKKDSTKRFKGCAAKFSIVDAFDKLGYVGAKATLFEHSGSEMPAERSSWIVEHIYDIQYVDGLKPGITYTLYVEAPLNSDSSELVQKEITFSFDKDGGFKEIEVEMASQTMDDFEELSVYDFNTNEKIDFISADLYEKTAFGDILIKHFKDYSELSSVKAIKELRDNDYYMMTFIVSEKYRDALLLSSIPGAENITMYEGTGDTVDLDGDANCDEQVNMADVVLIMQSLANPDKYGINGTDKSHITERGQKNGDIYEKGSGITNSDALQIQKILLGIKD